MKSTAQKTGGYRGKKLGYRGDFINADVQTYEPALRAYLFLCKSSSCPTQSNKMSGIQSSAAAEACFIPAEITANSSMNTGGNLDLGLSLSGSELVLSPDKLSVKVNEIVQQLLSDRGFLPNL